MAWTQSPSLFLNFGIDQEWTSFEFKRIIQDIDKNTPSATADYISFGYDYVTVAWGGPAAGPLSSKGPCFSSDRQRSMSIQGFGVAQGCGSTYSRSADFVNGAANNFPSTVSSLDENSQLAVIGASGKGDFGFPMCPQCEANEWRC